MATTTDTTTTVVAAAVEELSAAEQNARGWQDQILASFEAHLFCLGQLEGRDLSREGKACLKEHRYDGTNAEYVADWIEDAMREAPLSVEIREGWKEPGDSISVDPTQFRILLSTGGPALRVFGDLDGSEPVRCWLEAQDWGQGWFRVYSRSEDQVNALRWFASLFWFGES